MKKVLLTLAALTVSFSALADQCAYMQPAQADKAVEVLSAGTVAYHFCEPCGDLKPVKMNLNSVEAHMTDSGNYKEVSINGYERDMAYVYDANGNNVALQAGCPTEFVSPSIEL